MKTTIQYAGTKFSMLLALLFTSAYCMAQDGTSQTNAVTHSTSSVTTPDPMWYSNPLVWVAGVVVLLIIIIAVARSGKRTVSDTEVSRTTTTTTTVKED